MRKKVKRAEKQKKESWIETENGCKFILKMKEQEEGRLAGSVQPLFGNAPLEFYEIGSLLLALDRLMDALAEEVSEVDRDSAEAEGADRRQENSKIYDTWLKTEIEHGSIIREIPEEEREELQKNTEIFFVCIRYRRYGSWQGEIRWDGKNTKYFRSELELLHLINSVFIKEKESVEEDGNLSD